MDVLGLGVLITGESGVGKSELGLELISRGHGLVADDVVEISRIGPAAPEGRCPPMLKDFLEVRGPGPAQHPHHLRRDRGAPRKNEAAPGRAPRSRCPAGRTRPSACRSPASRGDPRRHGRKVTSRSPPGATSRCWSEAAVRNEILKLRGIDTTAEFLARQAQQMNGDE